MSKKGYSKSGLFGCINHYDANGKKAGESRLGFFGSMNDYDANGNKIGHSSPSFLVDIIITMNKNCKGGTDMAQQKEGDSMGLFKKKNVKKSYDRECMKPVIRASICTGEQVAGFKDMQTGKLEEIMLIKSPKDLDDFKNMFGITEEIEKEY